MTFKNQAFKLPLSLPHWTVGILVTLLSAGCVTTTDSGNRDTNKPSHSNTVTGDWQLLQISDYTRSKYRNIYQRFTLRAQHNGISGTAANNYSARVHWGKNHLFTASDLATTRKMAMGMTGQLEQIYLHRLVNATRWEINGQQLTLSGAEGHLLFQR